MRREQTRRAVLGALGTAVAGSVAGCGTTAPKASSRQNETTNTTEATAQQTWSESPYTRVYRDVRDSVVLVRVGGPGGGGQGSGFVYDVEGGGDGDDSDDSDDGGGDSGSGGDGSDGKSSEQEPSDERYVVTNQHVVAGADRIRIQFREGEWRPAELVGADVYSDLAVLRVRNVPGYATPLSVAERDGPVGTEVVAIGSPFGLGGSASAGIISGQNRSLTAASGFTVPGSVQTDAAVNPGNSGGPLVNLDGTVVGVVSAGGGDNIAFAVSAALVRRVVPALVETGDYRHAFMGVRLAAVTPPIATANDLDVVRGVLVVGVVPGGPSAGTLRGSDGEEAVGSTRVPVGGDVIVALDGTRIGSQSDLATYLAIETSPGDDLDVTILRDGERQTVTVTLGARPEQ
ncbi:S1C family serine protease [Haloprofundus salilacus]|uniref:S1C family serine protease n=1 Tax=Haloprofundus salilacus TaxID=2876190 RepID=UPI001CCC61D9|nr:trypsin-like peptidase domain-containing protein [Haloprofundus salilacus]